MIAEQSNIEITRSKSFKESAFKLSSTNPAIFRILRSGIYSDKVLAPLREYSCNSADSHVAANKRDTPIEITLPNILEPTLKIRDFGAGLNDKEIRNIFCTYGESTKSDSNDYIGQMGIGSKSAFAYTNTFQVTSWTDKKRIYNCYIDEEEIGKIALLSQSEKESDETGIEIAIPVRMGDITTFAARAKELFRFWDIKPIIKGCAEFKHLENEWLIRGDNWGFLKSEKSYGGYNSTPSYIVMGGVPYKISPQSIPNLDGIHTNILNKSAVFFADIGEIQIASSREEISYSDKTVNWLKDQLRKVESEARAQIDSKLTSVKTEYEARELYFEYFSTNGRLGNVLTQVLGHNYELKFNDKIIDNQLVKKTDPIKAIDEFYLNRSYKSTSGYVLRYENSYSINFFHKSPENVSNFKRFFYYIAPQDISVHKLRRLLRYYLKESFGSPVTDETIYILRFNDIADLDSWRAEIGIPDNTFVELFSTIVLPVKPKAPKVIAPRRTENARVWDGKGWFYHDLDLANDSGCYVLRRHNDYGFDINGLDLGGDPICEAIYFLQETIENFNHKIFAVTPTSLKKIGKNLLPLKDLVAANIKNYYKQFKTVKIPEYWVTNNVAYSDSLMNYVRTNEIDIPKNHPLNIVKKETKQYNALKTYNNVAKYFGLNEGYNQNRIIELQKILQENSDLLKFDDIYRTFEREDQILFLNAKIRQLEGKAKKTPVMATLNEISEITP